MPIIAERQDPDRSPCRAEFRHRIVIRLDAEFDEFNALRGNNSRGHVAIQRRVNGKDVRSPQEFPVYGFLQAAEPGPFVVKPHALRDNFRPSCPPEERHDRKYRERLQFRMRPNDVGREESSGGSPGMDEVESGWRPQRIAPVFLQRVLRMILRVDDARTEGLRMMVTIGKFLVQADCFPRLPGLLPFQRIEAVGKMHIGVDGRVD